MSIQQEKELINSLEQLRKQYKITEIYTTTDKYLKVNQPSIDLLLRISVLFNTPPIADEEKSIAFSEKALEVDRSNPYAIIILTYVYYFDVGPGEIPGHIYEKSDSLKNCSPEIQSMIEYVKSWYWKNKDEKKYADVLKRSVELCDQYVNNVEDLGHYYLNHNDIEKGRALRCLAFDNIKKVYDDNYVREDVLEEFLNASIKGTSVTQWRYNELKKIVNSYQ